MAKTQRSIDALCVNTIRTLAMDAVEAARSGHPGAPMGLAPAGYVLWTRVLKHHPRNPGWPDRDRFVLSAGHASALLYGLLHLCGYGLPLAELRRFRQWGSRTPGHPEFGHTPGVETTTGPLGQGFANAVGMAIAERHLAARFNRGARKIVDHFTYVFCGDGDLMEGVSAEAASLAGHLGLGRLICLYDDNHVTIDGGTELAFTEDVARRFSAYGWHVLRVRDGNDLEAIEQAFSAARAETGRPSLILCRTQIAYGSPNKQGSHEAHGAPLGAEEIRLTKHRLGFPAQEPFFIPKSALSQFRRCIDRGTRAEAAWPSSLRRSGSLAKSCMAPARVLASFGGMRIPSTPSMSASGVPPVRVAMTAAPLAMAATKVMEKGSSQVDGNTKRSAFRSRSARPLRGTKPSRYVLSWIPCSLILSFRKALNGSLPSPMMRRDRSSPGTCRRSIPSASTSTCGPLPSQSCPAKTTCRLLSPL